MTSPTWTIARVLDWIRTDFAGRGMASPRLDGEIIVAQVLSLPRVQLYVRHEQPLSATELASIRALVERRRKSEPIAYITGRREFYGRDFAVDRRVLVPRPETEGVVEAVLERIEKDAAARVLDIGTGSGAIAVTVAVERANVVVDAVDLSPGAAEVARANAAKHGVSERVTVREGSLFAPVDDQRYDVIASNPPYIATAEIDGLMADVRDHEPHLALDGGADGLRVLVLLIGRARSHLNEGGTLVVELGHDQGERAAVLAREAGFEDVSVRKDLAGIPRVLVAR